jgi:hypothetical protein
MGLTVIENPYGTSHVYDVEGKEDYKSVTIRFRADHQVKLTFYESKPNGTELLSVLFRKELVGIINQFLAERELYEIIYDGSTIQWDMNTFQIAVCDPNGMYKSRFPMNSSVKQRTHYFSSICDFILFEFCQHFGGKRDTWLHEMIRERKIDPVQFQHAIVKPPATCTTIGRLLTLMRDLILLPEHMPISQQRILPGKMGVFSLLTVSLNIRNQQEVYHNLKRFLQSSKEDKAHQQLYYDYIVALTLPQCSLGLDSLSVVDIDGLFLDHESLMTQYIYKEYFQQERG